MATHGYIDGYSRKIIWIQVCTTNNKPGVIYYYYLMAVKKLKIVPRLVRSDHGTEKSIVETVHQVLRFNHEHELAGIKRFIKGKSTHQIKELKAFGEGRGVMELHFTSGGAPQPGRRLTVGCGTADAEVHTVARVR